MSLVNVKAEIQKRRNLEKAKVSSRFFKTQEGEYGYGDVFIGITVPESRSIAKQFSGLNRTDVLGLLHSKYHEERHVALFILIIQYKKENEEIKKELYELYLANTTFINNWDLIDSSAEYIVGDYLYRQKNNILSKKTLSNLAHSDSLWERRIAMLSTFAFLKKGESGLTYFVAELLRNDKHDLIQKAVGWLLREAGKRVSETEEKTFLTLQYKTMPRTMLRYAIERFSEDERRAYLLGQK